MPECQVLSLYPEQRGHHDVVAIPCPRDLFCRVSSSLPSLWSGVKPTETVHSKAGWPSVPRQVFESLGICSPSAALISAFDSIMLPGGIASLTVPWTECLCPPPPPCSRVEILIPKVRGVSRWGFGDDEVRRVEPP